LKDKREFEKRSEQPVQKKHTLRMCGILLLIGAIENQRPAKDSNELYVLLAGCGGVPARLQRVH
jgi:hypothetical protein